MRNSVAIYKQKRNLNRYILYMRINSADANLLLIFYYYFTLAIKNLIKAMVQKKHMNNYI